MPFTPFHFGVGAALKAAAPRHFSLSVFCFAQVLTDTEVLFHMARGDALLHQHLHSPLGAALVGAVSFVVGRPACQWVLRWWHAADVQLKEYFDPAPGISQVAAITGAWLGSFSHVALDAIMHADVRPLSPWSEQNALLGLLGPGALHAACCSLGIAGILACATWRRHVL
jgi:hypothetical protein